MNYSNTARQLARAATLKNVEELSKPTLKEDEAILYKPELYIVPLPFPDNIKNTNVDKLGDVNNRLVALNLEPLNPPDKSRTVVILLTQKFRLGLFNFIGFPPVSLKPIIYTMPKEPQVN